MHSEPGEAMKSVLIAGHKFSMTFVNIALAISALAGGGAFQDFAPGPNPGGVFVIFRRFLDV